jgi:hypothetical protein
MLTEGLKGFLYAGGIVILVALWVVPDPVGKIITLWRFFRGDRLDEISNL